MTPEQLTALVRATLIAFAPLSIESDWHATTKEMQQLDRATARQFDAIGEMFEDSTHCKVRLRNGYALSIAHGKWVNTAWIPGSTEPAWFETMISAKDGRVIDVRKDRDYILASATWIQTAAWVAWWRNPDQVRNVVRQRIARIRSALTEYFKESRQ